jgi:hypothetical protein
MGITNPMIAPLAIRGQSLEGFAVIQGLHFVNIS